MLIETIALAKWLPWITIFYLFFTAINHLDVNRLLLGISIFLDIVGYIASFAVE